MNTRIMKTILTTTAAAAIILAASLTASPARAQYESDNPGLQQDTTISFTHETTSNIYGSNTNEESAARFVAKIDTTFTWAKTDRSRFTGGIAVAQHDYIDITGEDYKDSTLKIGYETDLNDTTTAALELSTAETDAPLESSATLDNRDNKTLIRINYQIGEIHTLQLEAWRAKQKYTRYSELEYSTTGFSAAVTRDLGGFTSLDLALKHENKQYTNEHILSDAGEETTATRTDRSNTASLTVTKIISLAPISFVQAGIEQENNTSNNAEYYLWFDTGSFDFPTKTVRGYDTYKKRTAYIYASQGLGPEDTLSAYYLLDKTKYPSRLLGNYGDSEPFISTMNTLEYISLTLRHDLNQKQSLEAGGAWTHSRSNDTAYAYNERTLSLGLNIGF